MIYRYSRKVSAYGAVSPVTRGEIARNSGYSRIPSFNKKLEKLAKITIRDANTEEALLDERLMLSPAFAIAEARALAVKMAQAAQESGASIKAIEDKYAPNRAERRQEERAERHGQKQGSRNYHRAAGNGRGHGRRN